MARLRPGNANGATADAAGASRPDGDDQEPTILRIRGYTPLALLALAAALGTAAAASAGERAGDPAIVTIHSVAHARGLMVTSGGWAYCEQLRALARRTRYTLLCGRYAKDGYLGYRLRDRRHLDWGNPSYLAALAAKVRAVHRRVGGELLLLGVSYSGFGVATLASHHAELRPDRLIVIDTYTDLVARRAAVPDSHQTARDIDDETGGSTAELRARSVSASGLADLVRTGTELTVIWSISPDEQREFNGATCDRRSNAGLLLRLAGALRRPVVGWVTENRHGHDLWNHGTEIIAGHPPGKAVVFRPNAAVPRSAACRSSG